MDEKGSKKIIELSETQKEAKIVGINPMFGRFTMLREWTPLIALDPILEVKARRIFNNCLFKVFLTLLEQFKTVRREN